MHKLPTLVSGRPGSSIHTEVVPVYSGSSPSHRQKNAYGAILSRLKKESGFEGKEKSVQFVRFGGRRGAKNVLFVGLGKTAELTPERLRQAGAAAWSKALAEKATSLSIDLDALGGPDQEAQAFAFVEGLCLGAYAFDKHKSKSIDSGFSIKKIVFTTRDRKFQPAIVSITRQVTAIVESVNITRDWSNEPSNWGTPKYYAEQAKELGKKFGLKVTVLNERDALREKMGLFLGVGAGSEREGRIVVCEYEPKKSQVDKNSKQQTIAFVGKGVTFDSGGISIKPSLRMEDMKHDMTGAATLFGATVLAARMGCPNRIVTILAFTENMPDGCAIQPGNVLRARNGKTVEIINTDAEGRLILADVLDYAHGFKPDVIVDAATLTGAVGVALGKYCCGLMSNDDQLAQEIQQLGEETGERMWQLPLYDEYFDDMKSDSADMKNSCNDGYGGTIRGAIFLKQFVHKGMPWAHLDIATTSSNVTHIPYFPKRGASGAFVRSLAKFAIRHGRSEA